MRISTLIKKVLLVIFVIAVLVFNLRTDAYFADAVISADDRFGNDYSVAHILKNYSYFIGGNMGGNAVAHTSGPIVVGGELDFAAAGFGNIMTAPSYINHIKGLGYINAPFPGTEGLQTKRVVYYGTVDASVPDYLFFNETGHNTKDNVLYCNPDYIDVTAAMQALRNESNALAVSGSTDAYTNQKGEIRIDLKKATSITVSEPLNQIQRIILENVTIEELMNSRYVISFSASGEATVNAQMIWLNDKTLDQQFKDYAIAHSGESASTGGQYYLQGMNLIWNYPQATKVTYMNLNGHLLAPNAEVKTIGGRHEGGVIAASLYTESEAHFYPFYPKKPGATTEGSSSETTEGSSSETTEGSSSETTEGSSSETTEGSSSETTEGSSSETTEGSSSETTEGSSSETTEGSSSETTEGSSSETTEGSSSETTEGSSSETTKSGSTSTTAVRTGDSVYPVAVGILAVCSILISGLSGLLMCHKKR